MKKEHDNGHFSDAGREQLLPRLDLWAERLHTLGLDSLCSVFLDAAAPLAPLGAQLLYVAQPTLGLVISRELLGALAHVLETPGGVDWLQGALLSDMHGAASHGAASHGSDLLADKDDKA